MGFKVPKRTAVLKFEGDYEGAEVKIRLDAPIGTFLEIQDLVTAGKQLEVFAVFGDELLISWNLEDDKGKPLPATGTGMKALPIAFGNVLIAEWLEAIQNVPAPLAKTSAAGSTSAAAQ